MSIYKKSCMSVLSFHCALYLLILLEYGYSSGIVGCRNPFCIFSFVICYNFNKFQFTYGGSNPKPLGLLVFRVVTVRHIACLWVLFTPLQSSARFLRSSRSFSLLCFSFLSYEWSLRQHPLCQDQVLMLKVVLRRLVFSLKPLFFFLKSRSPLPYSLVFYTDLQSQWL